MIPKLVTFDCAQTLVRVPEDWSLGKFAVDCARHIGFEPATESERAYLKLYVERLPEFFAVNQSRDADRAKAFWRQLTIDWMGMADLPLEALNAMLDASDELGFGENSILFSLFDDVIPCLDQLDRMGIKAAVISNWDHSLHRVLKMFGIYERFVTVKASLEEGVEKPDPRLFEITLAAAGFTKKETFHVGDLVEDDFEGARNAGIRAALIDRSQPSSSPFTMNSLRDLPEAFSWIG